MAGRKQETLFWRKRLVRDGGTGNICKRCKTHKLIFLSNWLSMAGSSLFVSVVRESQCQA